MTNKEHLRSLIDRRQALCVMCGGKSSGHCPACKQLLELIYDMLGFTASIANNFADSMISDSAFSGVAGLADELRDLRDTLL